MASSEDLGREQSVELTAGTIRYRERGAGPPVVFVHGLLVNADLWRKVVPAVAAAGHRCLAPDWPLGAHQVPMRRGADLSPPGMARLIAEFLAALDLQDVTMVANDTGGALTQILMAQLTRPLRPAGGRGAGPPPTHPSRIGRVVLTPADSFERFFPPMFNYLTWLLRLPGSTWLLSRVLRIRALHRLPLMFGWLTRRPIPAPIMDSYLRPCRDSGIRRDLRSFVTSVHRRYTLAAAAALRDFTKPVLLAWATEDRLFPISLGRRLAEVLPDARLVEVPDSRTFVPEDQPDVLARLIVEFVGGRTSDRVTAHPAGPLAGHPGGADDDGPRAVR